MLFRSSKKGKQEGSQLKALEMLGKATGLFTQGETKADEVISSEQLKRELAGHLRLVRQRSSAVQVIDAVPAVRLNEKSTITV